MTQFITHNLALGLEKIDDSTHNLAHGLELILMIFNLN